MMLREAGFRDVVTNVSYMPERIRGHFGRSGIGISLAYSDEPEPLGTAGGVGKVRDFLAAEESFLVISGDALTDIDLNAMREAHLSHDGIATLATKRVTDTSQFGVVITDSDGRIQGFQEKPDPAEALSDLANCGIYMFRPEIFDYFLRRTTGAPPAMTTSPPDSSTGRWTFSRPCSTATSRSIRTRWPRTPTGTTSGRSRSTCRATSTPSRGGSASRATAGWPRGSTPTRDRSSTGSRCARRS